MSTIVKKKRGHTDMLSRFWNAEKSLVSDFLEGAGNLWNWDEHLEIPSLNVVETEKDYEIEVAAPGKQKDDFKVEVGDGYLKISCEKKHKKDEKEPNFRRKEFSYDYFSRSLVIPDNTVPGDITARYEHGILYLRLPKKVVAPAKNKKLVKID